MHPHVVIHNNTQNTHYHLHLHPHVNNFGEENKEYITDEFVYRCFAMGWHGIDPMIDEIYFNKDHPENNNIRLVSLKNSLVQVKKEEGWKMQGLKDTIDRVIQNTGTHIVREASRMIPTEQLADELVVYNMNSIRNMESDAKKKIQERTRAKIVDGCNYYLGFTPSTRSSRVPVMLQT